MTTEARMPTNSEAICDFHFLKVFLSRVMRGQEQEEKNEKYVGLGTILENSFVLYNHAVL